MNSTRLFTASLALLLGTDLGAQTTDIAPTSLNPGDQIRIVVWRKPELSGDFPIAPNGTITHPLYKAVRVTGLSISTVEERLRTFLTQYEVNPQFVVQPLVKIIVGGEVRNPNVYSVPPETTIAQAIALAGGPTDRGQIRDVSVVRDQQVVKVDVSRPSSEDAILQIRSNDQILVGRRGTSFGTIIGPVLSSVAAIAAIASIFVK